MKTMRTETTTLIEAMRILASDIQSEDGVANAAIAEAADRLDELQAEVERLHGERPSPRVSRIGKHLTLVFDADELSSDEKQALFDRARAMSWSHAIDDRKAAEKERDQLKQMLISLSDVCDAVFEWVDSVPDETILPAMPGLDRDYADQLRQQAQEVQP